MSIENLAKTIEPKSDQLNADDLLAGPITITVAGVVESGAADQPIDIRIDGMRPYRPCKSMRRVLIACWGSNGKAWVGRSMTLYNDPKVRFGGADVGGIRISHLSDLDAPEKRLLLTTAKSKRSEYKVSLLEVKQYPDADFAANSPAWKQAIAAGKISVAEIMARTAAKGRLTPAQVAELTEEAAT